MPRNPIISEVQAEDQATNSPVRRSSRLINGSSHPPSGTTSTNGYATFVIQTHDNSFEC